MTGGPERLRPATLTLLAALLCACAGLPRAAATRVELADVQLTLAGEGQGELRLALELDNPHPEVRWVRELRWELWLDGQFFAAGADVLAGRMGARARGRMEVAAKLTYRVALCKPQGQTRVAVRGRVLLEQDGTTEEHPLQLIAPKDLPLAPCPPVREGLDR